MIYQNLYHNSWFGIAPTFWGIVISAFGIQDGWALPNPCVNNPTWYVSVLVLCYVAFYLLVYVAKRLRVMEQYLFVFMIFLGMGINTYGINLPFFNASSCRGYYAFFFGVLLADFLKKHKINKKDMIVSVVIVVTITLLIIYENDFIASGINYVMTFMYYPALIVIFKSNIIVRALNRGIIGNIGKISFDVFIWHNPLYIVLFIFMKAFNLNLNLNSYTTMIGYAIVCYIFGAVSYYIIEHPSSKLFEEKLRGIYRDETVN